MQLALEASLQQQWPQPAPQSLPPPAGRWVHATDCWIPILHPHVSGWRPFYLHDHPHDYSCKQGCANLHVNISKQELLAGGCK